ncbi:MAG: DNA-formamidopyrimidine glycosylase family protein, partial [bacterium]
MPELPELETLVKALDSRIENKKLGDPIIINPKVIMGDPKIIVGKSIKEISRRGKWIVFSLNGLYLTFHLRLNGYLFLLDYSEPDTYDCIIFPVNGEYLHFGDPRKLAQVHITKDIRNLEEELGIDPFSQEFTIDYLTRELKKKKTNIKTFLMDQDIISGIGNTYTDEILFDAKINPRRPCNNINQEETERLYYSIINILKEAIKLGGTSIEEF